MARAVGPISLSLLPGALVMYLGFEAGGFFPGTTAFAVVVLAVVLMARMALAERPFEGFTRASVVAVAAFGLLAMWTLASAGRSGSTERALVEFDRVILYGLVLVLFASIPRRSQHMRWMVRGVALGTVAVAGAGFLSRVLPDVFGIPANLADSRLSYPVTYWNALGLVAATGVILCVHLASSTREPRAIRVLAAAPVPALAATLYFTLSRGALAAGAIGLLLYVVLGRPRALLTGLVATVPATAIAVASAYNADRLTEANPTVPAAVAQGHDVATVVALCTAAALVLRLILLPLDSPLARLRLPSALRLDRRARLATGAALAVVAVALSIAAGLPGELDDQYDRFTRDATGEQGGSVRERLTDPGNKGRVDQWNVALDDFRGAKLAGQGAGTWELSWKRERDKPEGATDAHSLYLEVLGELGIVGLVLLLVAIGLALLALAARVRQRHRSVYAASFAAAGAWAVHAGVDWDWEMPVTTLWVFAAGGLALARAPRGDTPPGPPPRSTFLQRAGVILATLLIALPAAQVGISEARLDDMLGAYERGDCARALNEARSVRSALGARIQPYQVTAYCHAGLGRRAESLEAAEEAVDRDADNWEVHYTLATVRAAFGLDPRVAARAALRLNPLDSLARDAVKRFAGRDARAWKRGALATPLPLGPNGPVLVLSELSARGA